MSYKRCRCRRSSLRRWEDRCCGRKADARAEIVISSTMIENTLIELMTTGGNLRYRISL